MLAADSDMVFQTALLISLVLGNLSPTPASADRLGPSPWPLGVLQIIPGQPSCLTGYTCSKFVVSSCSGVSADAQGVMAEADPTRSARGVVVFFSGDDGKDWWSDPSSLADQFLSRLRTRDGFVVIQVRWIDSWLKAPRGEESGSAHLACRSSTVTDWIYWNVYVPLNFTPRPGQCGFCISGNSGGASQASYALSHYGLEGELNGVFPTSGPPHAAEVKGCLPGYPGYRYEAGAVTLLDYSFGFDDEHGGLGPCLTQDPAFSARWTEESVDTGANDTSHPTVRIQFIIGADDVSSAVPHAGDYRDLLELDTGNHVTWTLVPDMGHSVQASVEGLRTLEKALTA
jgi:hypothetical protein